MTREEWLNIVARDYLWPRIKAAGGKVPAKYRLSIGFPKGSRGGRSGHAIGQCWSRKASADGTIEVFVSPELAVRDTLHVLAHELVHASVGPEVGHRAPFKRLVHAIGLTGAMRATKPTDEFAGVITEWLRRAPRFPHAPLSAPRHQRKPGSRLIKSFCPGCGYTVRVTRQWLDVADPACPNPECDSQGEPMIAER